MMKIPIDGVEICDRDLTMLVANREIAYGAASGVVSTLAAHGFLVFSDDGKVLFKVDSLGGESLGVELMIKMFIIQILENEKGSRVYYNDMYTVYVEWMRVFQGLDAEIQQSAFEQRIATTIIEAGGFTYNGGNYIDGVRIRTESHPTFNVFKHFNKVPRETRNVNPW